MKRALLLGALCLAAGLQPSLAVRAEEAEAPVRTELRSTMAQIFGSLRVLLPLGVSEGEDADPARREEARAALEKLSANASALAAHGRRKDAGFGHLSRYLAADSRDLQRSFEAGEVERFRFLLRQITEYCVTCHARLPSPGDSSLSEHFIDQQELRALPLEERATLLIATRRFDEGLAALEQLLASPAAHPASLLSPITDYLVVSIRVKGDLKRPVPTLERFATRPDLWRNLRLDVERWIAALHELSGRDLPPADPATARRLLDEARRMISFPADRSALVHYIVASGMLHRYVEAHSGEQSASVAEAYYHLGLIESRIGREYWVSQTGAFLESCIRLAPREPFAEQAYALLEEEIILGYSGSAGIDIPADLERNLAELEQLIDGP